MGLVDSYANMQLALDYTVNVGQIVSLQPGSGNLLLAAWEFRQDCDHLFITGTFMNSVASQLYSLYFLCPFP